MIGGDGGHGGDRHVQASTDCDGDPSRPVPLGRPYTHGHHRRSPRSAANQKNLSSQVASQTTQTSLEALAGNSAASQNECHGRRLLYVDLSKNTPSITHSCTLCFFSDRGSTIVSRASSFSCATLRALLCRYISPSGDSRFLSWHKIILLLS